MLKQSSIHMFDINLHFSCGFEIWYCIITIKLTPNFRFWGGNIYPSGKCSGSWESWFPHYQIVQRDLRNMGFSNASWPLG